MKGLKRFLVALLIFSISIIHLQSVLGADKSQITLFLKDNQTVLSHANVTITDIDTSQSYYLCSDKNGNVQMSEEYFNELHNHNIIISAVINNTLYNLCTVLDKNDLYLEKDDEPLLNIPPTSRVVSGDWVSNSYTHVGTVWVALDCSPTYGGLSTKTTYSSSVGYEISGGSFLTCSFSSLTGTSIAPPYTSLSDNDGKRNYVLYGEVNKYKVEQSQVGTGNTRTRYMITNGVIDVKAKIETGTFSTNTSSTDTKLTKSSKNIITKSITYTYSISDVKSYDYGLTYKISATGSKKVDRTYKQYTNTYNYRIGFNALKRSTSEI